MTTTSPALISRAWTAANAAISPSNTRAGPVCAQPLVPGELHDAALGRERAAEDREAAGAASGPRDAGRTTSWPGVSTASLASSKSVRPVTVIASFARPASTRRCATRRDAPGARRGRRAVKRPPGLRSTKSGVRAEIASKSSSDERHARLARDRQEVEDGVRRAARRDHGRDRVLEGRRASGSSTASGRPSGGPSRARPTARATSALRGSVAGTSFAPIGERPRNVERRRHRVRRELAAARAGARARPRLDVATASRPRSSRPRARRPPRRRPGS